MKRFSLLGGMLLLTIGAVAAPPGWWSGTETRILEEEGDEANYAPANLGQLKYVAKQAQKHLDAALVDGAGTEISSFVANFTPKAGVTYTSQELEEIISANYAPVNLGQVKAVAKPFYDRLLLAGYDTKANLIARGYPSTWAYDYPWDPTTPVSENYAPANLGQLKMVFSFDLTDFDTDQDGLPDWWEMEYFSDLNQDAEGDFDGDGISNHQERRFGSSPTSIDTDGDGLPDGWEADNGTDLLVDDSAEDLDGDGYSNLREYSLGLDPNIANYVQVSSGGRHTLILRADGTVWSVGSNSFGELGLGTTTDREQPAQISGLTDIVQVTAGESHSLALKRDGTVYAWGRNNFGQIGVAGGDQNTPVAITTLTGVKQVEAGLYASFALLNDGTLKAWGRNATGQLGDGTKTHRNVPTAIPSFTNVKEVAAGHSHAIALKEDGSVWAWGSNLYGQVGDGTTTERTSPTEVLTAGSAVKVAAGLQHNFALKPDGTLFAWGLNDINILGLGTSSNQLTPIAVPGFNNVVKIDGSRFETMARRSDGSVWVWGYNENMVAGNGSNGRLPTPIQSSYVDVDFVGLGVDESFAIKDDGTVWTSGVASSFPQGADGHHVFHALPAETGMLNIAQVAAGAHHMLLLREDGTVVASGRNEFGQLGDDTTMQKQVPVDVENLTSVDFIGVAPSHSLAIKNGGEVWTWGSNGSGRLGDGTGTNRHTPVQVSGITTAIAVGGGDMFSAALLQDGTVRSWGNNANGRLGDGTAATRITPVTVKMAGNTLTNIQALSVGDVFTLALKNDGTVVAWGYNGNGAIGDGTLVDRTEAVAVSSLTGVTQISAGFRHSLALKGDGTVWAWGFNSTGQLGLGDTTSRNTPTTISGLSGITQVASGFRHSLALKNDGTVWAWGGNLYGQLGQGTTASSLTPVQVQGLQGVVSIFAGDNYSVAVKEDGSITVWGGDVFGQLGLGGTRSVPQEVLGVNAYYELPNVAITAPSENVSRKFNQPVTFAFSSANPENVAKIELYQQGLKIGEVTEVTDTITWTPSTWGVFEFHAVAFDGEGRKSARTEQIEVTVAYDDEEDGLPDWWEMEYFGNLDQDGAGDFDDDGFTNLQEFEGNGNPADFYDQAGTIITPVISIISGSGQSAMPNEFLTEALKVRVTDGTNALENAPVIFAVTQGGGLVARAFGDFTQDETLIIRTDVDGYAEVFYLQGDGISVVSKIMATAGSTPAVEFTAETEVLDADEDGLPDAWEMTIVNADPHDAITSIEDILPGGNLDGDSLTNLEEWELGLNPLDPSDAQARFEIVSGNEQTMGANTTTSAPLKIAVYDFLDREMVGKTVKVTATETGLIRLAGTGTFVRSLESTTDVEGEVSIDCRTLESSGQSTVVRCEAPYAPAIEAKFHTSGWMGWWQFNEGVGTTAKDKSPFGQDISLHEVVWTERENLPAIGLSETTESFGVVSGSSDSLELGLGSFTVMAWVKTEQVGIRRLVGQGYRERKPGFALDIGIGGDGRISGSIGLPGEGGMRITTTSTVDDGDWHHVAFVVNRENDSVGIFIDGIRQSVQLGETPAGSAATSFPIAGEVHLPKGELLLLGAVFGAEEYFTGEMDEVKLYRGALSDGEVLTESTGDVDSDSDGLPDAWEQEIVDADPTDLIVDVSDVSPEDDFDGDGISNLQEFLAGTSPTDFYNGISPTIVINYGDGQSGSVGTVLTAPISVSVYGKNGIIMFNAPLSVEPQDTGARVGLSRTVLNPNLKFRLQPENQIYIRP